MGVRVVFPPAGRYGSPTPAKTSALRTPEEWNSGYLQPISQPMKLITLTSTALQQWMVSLFIKLYRKRTTSPKVLLSQNCEAKRPVNSSREGGRWRRIWRGRWRRRWRGRKGGGEREEFITCPDNDFVSHDHDRQL